MSQSAKTPGLVLSIDGMGGDHAPGAIIDGLDLARVRHMDVRFLVHGDEAKLAPLIAAKKGLSERVTISHASDVVGMDDKPSQALRRGRNTSMWRAIAAVKAGEAAGVVSAGNTGALMAMSKFQLRPMEGIDRPALAALWPTRYGSTVVLDVGANIGSEARHLVDFAIMGGAFARTVFGLDSPTVALLNIGTEEMKGNEQVKLAAQTLRDATGLQMTFTGYVEGDGISAGVVDVVVTEGFTGNIALKAAEGTARLVGHWLREALRRSVFSMLGGFLASGAFRILKIKMDPRSVNGGVFLGLNGIVVKSHGGTDGYGFATALDLAVDMARHDITRRIAEGLNAIARPAVARAVDETAVAESAGPGVE